MADRMTELTLGPPSGLVRDLTGPKVCSMADLIGGYLKLRSKRRLMVPVRIPGKVGRAYRAGGNLTLEGADVGRRTWEDFLSERLSPAARNLRSA